MLIIEEKKIEEWLRELKKAYQVFDLRNSVLPAKQYFFPPQEELFVFNKKSKGLKTPDKSKKAVVFGLNWPDLVAMSQLDEIMKSPESDFYYWQRRKKTIIVGLAKKSKDMPPAGDLVLKKINKGIYQALVLNSRGDRIIKKDFFKEKHISHADIKKYPIKKTALRKLLLDPELLHDAVKWSKNHQIWDRLAEQCLGCGICTYVCPICHCFSIEDRVALDNQTCSRCRYWDACTLPGFSEIAGGHHFHQSIKERYYNWFYHKFVRAYNEYGRAQCVACGRCQDNCPAGINIEEVLKEIVKDYNKLKQ